MIMFIHSFPICFPFLFILLLFVCVACIYLARIDVVSRHSGGSNDDKNLFLFFLLEGHFLFYWSVLPVTSWEIEAYIMIMSPPGDTGKKPRHTIEENRLDVWLVGKGTLDSTTWTPQAQGSGGIPAFYSPWL